MNGYINKVFIAIVIALLITPSAYSQKRKASTKKAAPVVVESTPEELNYANLLPATARLMFIDSVVVDIDNIYDGINIASSCGELKAEKKDSHIDYSYTNDFGTLRYLSIADKDGIHHLYSQQRLGRNWTEPKEVTIEGDMTDIICPYLMPDGVTLYFAAREGEDNVGGHDLYYTVYDSDSRTFYRPQSLGLPYNSMSEDLCCIIDDINNLGHLATTRRQPDGKVCIYTFIPTESRETYDADMATEQLASFAALNSIKDTHTDKQVLADALNRFKNIRDAASGDNSRDFTFVVNEKKTYHRLSDFRSPSNAERYQTYANRLAELKQTEEMLSEMRTAYHNGDKSKSKSILSLESEVMKERKALADLEKQIRNAELIKK